MLNPPLRNYFFLQNKSGVNLTGLKTTPAMNHNRPDSVALRMRCLPHEGENGQCVFWNTHVRPLGIMVLSHYAPTRPPFLGTLQQKHNFICKQPTSSFILFPYLIAVELALNIPAFKEKGKGQCFCLTSLPTEWKNDLTLSLRKP